MDNTLENILTNKREEISQKKESIKPSDIKQLALAKATTRDFSGALKRALEKKKSGIIAEIKKASPSKGIIREDFDPVQIGRSYEDFGATCLSILTDSKYFQGSDHYLEEVKDSVSLPILRKDFIVDAYQVYESRVLGADCVLLIVAALKKNELKEFFDLATSINLDVLVEVHNEQELETALELNLDLIGINNRNLKTFDTTLRTTIELLEKIPPNITVVTESGIASRKDVELMRTHDINCFLIGESFMRAKDPGQKLKEMFFEGH